MIRTSLPTTATTEDLGFLLAKASQRFNQRLVEAFAARGFGDVRASYGSVLVPLFERDGLRLGELAAAAQLSKQAMTGLVKRCEGDELVRARTIPRTAVPSTCGSPAGACVPGDCARGAARLDDELVRSLGAPNRDALQPSAQGSDRPMRTTTVTTVLSAPPSAVFEYLADIENLPEWATEFARELRVREGYKVVNGLGEFFFAITADRATGVIDMFAGPSKDQMAVFPTRVGAARRPHRLQLHDVPGAGDAR